MSTEVIESLPPEAPEPERDGWIRKFARVCGGAARVRNTRIPVWLLEAYRRDGLSEEEMLDAYPTLTEEDLVRAFAYAAAYPDEIERAIRENEEH